MLVEDVGFHMKCLEHCLQGVLAASAKPTLSPAIGVKKSVARPGTSILIGL